MREEIRKPAEPVVTHASTHRRLQAFLRRLRKGILHPVQARIAQKKTHRLATGDALSQGSLTEGEG